jgi:hypothetical protein
MARRELSPDEAAQGFHISGQWRGRDQHQCNFCAWDTLERDQMIHHLETGHRFKEHRVEVEVPRRLSVPLYDSNGKLIQTVSEKQLI